MTYSVPLPPRRLVNNLLRGRGHIFLHRPLAFRKRLGGPPWAAAAKLGIRRVFQVCPDRHLNDIALLVNCLNMIGMAFFGMQRPPQVAGTGTARFRP